jgi:hypothetical protein
MFFGRNSELSREDRIDIQDATTARVKLDMGFGSLKLRGGATSLMDAHFEYHEGMEPRVDYVVHNGRGELRVDQPSRPKSINITRNRWDVRLNQELPIDLEIDNGAGEAEVDASTLALTSFELDQAAGEGKVQLNGDQTRLTYVDADISAGKLELEMRGSYPAMRELRAETAAGQLKLDLTGQWSSDVDIKIEVVAGEATLRLPNNVNIIATATTSVGRVKSRGLVQDGEHYTREVPGAAGTLRIKANASVGQVVLEVAN